MISLWIEWFPYLLGGLWVSILLVAITLVIGLPLGILLALGSIVRRRWVSLSVIALIELVRGIPLLVLLYLVYFGLPNVGLTFDNMLSAIIAMVLNVAAYSSEIFRGGLLSVPMGQREAAASLGLRTRDQYFRIIIPQTMRAIMPALISYTILVFHGTSLAAMIAVSEVTGRAMQLGSVGYQYLPALTLAGILYAVVSIVVPRLLGVFGDGGWITRKLRRRKNAQRLIGGAAG